MGRKVLAAGTFDIIHLGHVTMLWDAKRLAGDDGELVVVVAKDENVRRFKGRDPIVPQEKRLYVVSNLKPVDRAVLGKDNPLDSILEERPDVIALGYDQWAEEGWLKEELRKRGLNVEVVRLPKYGNQSTSSIVNRIVKMFCQDSKE